MHRFRRKLFTCAFFDAPRWQIACIRCTRVQIAQLNCWNDIIVSGIEGDQVKQHESGFLKTAGFGFSFQAVRAGT